MNKKKKILKIIFINILAILLIFSLFEYHFYNLFLKRQSMQVFVVKYPLLPVLNRNYSSVLLRNDMDNRFFEYDKNFSSDKKPILLLGCSYTYGQHLYGDDIPSNKLMKLTNRWVYNFGIPGGDPMYSLFTMEKEEKTPLIKENKPEYIIYTYMFQHILRLINCAYYRMYVEHSYFDNMKYNFLYNFWTYSYIKDRQIDNIFWYDREFSSVSDIFYKIMGDLKKQTDKLFPNSKFIVLIYSDVNQNFSNEVWRSVGFDKYRMQKLFDIMYSSQFRKKLENLGMEVVSTEELIKRKMNKPNDRVSSNIDLGTHPTAEAWDEILINLVKRFNL